MLTRLGTAAMAALLATALLAGCSSTPSTEPTGSAANEPTASDSPSETAPTETPTPEGELDVNTAFRVIADASCARANAEGVVESTVDGNASNILVPKEFAYKDFNAVSVSKDDGSSLIWSTEDFVVCSASVGFAMSEDSGGTFDIDVTLNESDGSYSTVANSGSGVVMRSRYIVADGVFVGAFVGSREPDTEVTITYGMPTKKQVSILHAAVDHFLE